MNNPKRFAVSVVMLSIQSNGSSTTVHMKHLLYDCWAASHDEATGQAFRMAQTKYPTYKVDSICLFEIV